MMKKLLNKTILICLFLSSPSFSNSTLNLQTLDLKTVLQSASIHYPKIHEEKQKLAQAKARRLATDGAFDIEITQQTRKRTSGFYDGIYANQKIIKPLRTANAKLFAQYRLSDGTFPVYEDQFVTLDRGELAVGLSFSLLRDRDIDAYRLAIKNADLDVALAQFKQNTVLNHVLFEASVAYIEWLSVVKQLAVYRELLNNAQARQKAIKNRIQLGYAAQIDLLDNEQNVLKHEALLLKVKNEVNLRAMDLSLYYRDNKGQPITVHSNISPRLPTDLFPDILSDIHSIIEHALNTHPDILSINNTILKEKNNQRLYENELKPNADMMIKISQDAGDGSSTREGFESYIGFEFSMPLQRRQAKGKINKSQAKIKELYFIRQRLTEALKVSLQQSKLKYLNVSNQAKITQKRALITQKLLSQEQSRFDQGASDIFILNVREKDMAEAKINAITANLHRIMAKIELLGKAYQLTDLKYKHELK